MRVSMSPVTGTMSIPLIIWLLYLDITVLHAGWVLCIMLDSNILGNSAPRYILGLTTQITPCSPRPDAAAAHVQSDLQPSLKLTD